jgi:hypothetical protein
MKTRKSPSVIFSADEAPSSSITKSSIATPCEANNFGLCTADDQNPSAKLPLKLAVTGFLKSEQRSEIDASHLLSMPGLWRKT